MKTFYQISPLAIALFMWSCGGGDETTDETTYESDNESTEEVDETPVEATYEMLLKGEVEDNRTVVFETFVAPLPSTMYFGDGELSLNFYERRNQTEGPHMNVDIREGNDNNEVESLPEEYYQDDLKIHTDDGDVAVVGDYVRITGTFSEASDANYQYVDLKKIEKLDYSFDESIFDNAVELTDDFITNVENDNGYAYIDGTLELSMFMSSFDGSTYSVTINQDMNSYSEMVYINIGNGPSSMNALNEGFTDEDFIVRDYKGTEHNGSSKKFRLYGTFNQLDVDSKGIFHVEEIVVLD
ncbi:MAG: hypothetical protein HUJ25_02105 [Crocinitomicaceae bacterium]|nr:hypothetical protein [Crocinitomicaceae bacterium]